MSRTILVDGQPVTLSDADYAAQFPAPPAPPPPDVSGDAIIGAIADADRARLGPAQLVDIARIAWRPNVPAANPKLKRIAAALGTTGDAMRQAGLQAG